MERLSRIRRRCLIAQCEPRGDRSTPRRPIILKSGFVKGLRASRRSEFGPRAGGQKKARFFCAFYTLARFSAVKHTYLSLDTYTTETVKRPMASRPGFAPNLSILSMATVTPAPTRAPSRRITSRRRDEMYLCLRTRIDIIDKFGNAAFCKAFRGLDCR